MCSPGLPQDAFLRNTAANLLVLNSREGSVDIELHYRCRRPLLLSVFTLIISGCSVLAQQDQRASEGRADQRGRDEQTAGDSRSAISSSSEQKGATVNSPFDLVSEAPVGNAIDSPFNSPAAVSVGDAVSSPFSSQSEAEVEASLGSPFGSADETRIGVGTITSSFDRSNEAPVGEKGDNPSVLGAETVESLGKSGNEAAAEQQDQEDAGAEKAEAQRVGKASSPGLFGDSYQPELSGDARPAFSDDGWSAWYSLQDKDGSHIADVDIAYRYSSEAGKDKAHDLLTLWVLRNRSKTSLVIEYQLNIQCAEKCSSGWYSYRTVIRAGKSVQAGERELQQIKGGRVLKVSLGEGQKIVDSAR